jgi:Mn-dependent DtxR family transcriptional regulator
MTPLDDEILELLHNSPSPSLRLSPKAVAVNLDKSRNYCGERLRELAARGLVTPVEDGWYRITDDGIAYLEGRLDAGDQ